MSRRSIPIALLSSAIALLCGCGDKITPWSVRANMSPELMTMNRTSGQVLNDFARQFDTNLRYMQDDLYHTMMWDEPNKMGAIPIP